MDFPFPNVLEMKPLNGEIKTGGMNMKKLLTGFAAAALVLTFTATSALAASHHGRAVSRVCNGLQTGWTRPACSFVDSNGDGICDNYGNGNCHHEGCFVDNNGDGICDNYGGGNCHHEGNFVDSNGDGVCDNYGGGNCHHQGQGWGNGNGNGNGWGGGHHGQGHGGHHRW